MTAGNVEIVERVFSSWNDGDPDGFMEPYAQDAVLTTPPDFPEGGTFTGSDSIRDFFMSVREGWISGTSVVVKEVREIDDERVLGDLTWSGRSELSGIEAHFDVLVVFTLRDGKVVRAQYFFDRAEALRVAGLAG